MVDRDTDHRYQGPYINEDEVGEGKPFEPNETTPSRLNNWLYGLDEVSSQQSIPLEEVTQAYLSISRRNGNRYAELSLLVDRKVIAINSDSYTLVINNRLLSQKRRP